MRLRGKYKLFLILIAQAVSVRAQNPKYEYYNSRAEEYKFDDFVKAKLYADSALKTARELNDDKLIARAYNETGNVYSAHSKFKEFKEALIKAEEYVNRSGDKYVKAAILNNWGIYFERTGNYEKSVAKHLEALRIRQDLKNEKDIAASYENLGAVYFYMGDYDKCEKNTLKAVELIEGRGDKKMLGELYDNLGSCYFASYKDSLAEQYMLRSLALAAETNNKIGIENAYNNLASFYSETGKPYLAKSYLLKAMDLLVDSPDRISSVMQTMAKVYEKTNKADSALFYYNKALEIDKKSGNKYRCKSLFYDLSRFYFSREDYKNAYLTQQEFHALDDSLTNEANVKNIAELEAIYKTEKQEKEIELLNTLNKSERERSESSKKLLWISLGALLLALVAAVSFYRNFVRKKKDNVLLQEKNIEIQKQKDLIAEKNKEIVDSITYAKRLQEAILPPLEFIRKHLPRSFVLYLPKDIVAGDFYWTHFASRQSGSDSRQSDDSNKLLPTATQNCILLAVADCTGHGVPGAMVSVVCANALNAAVKEFGLKEPAKILDKVNELVEQTFEKSSSEVKDGMDISLIRIEEIKDNPENKLQKGKLIIPKGKSLTDVLESNKRYTIEWSGANNPLWYIKDGEWHEIKADKQPVGKFENRKPFTANQIELKAGDSFFLISDGFADQFGGAQGKKIKYKTLKELLYKNSNQTPDEQKDILEREFSSWKGNYEQVDDVCIIGVRL
jgi:serine phosphatase RsbU (regulator of sigma subunit)/Tfp pilus assembly protein PilF